MRILELLERIDGSGLVGLAVVIAAGGTAVWLWERHRGKPDWLREHEAEIGRQEAAKESRRARDHD